MGISGVTIHPMPVEGISLTQGTYRVSEENLGLGEESGVGGCADHTWEVSYI